jgi:hypothetical protein
MTIQKSQGLGELFGALSKLQGRIENAKKDKSGFNNRYRYADLNQYLELSKDLLAEYGLSVVQIPGGIEIIEVTNESNEKQLVPKQKLTTCIGHESGQFISGTMEMIVEKLKSNSWGQSTGSALSYMRRYAIAATLGMSQEDNDNMLSKKEGEKSHSSSPKLDKNRVDYLKELLKDEPERLEKILIWASQKQNQKLRSIEDMSIEIYTATINILLEEKIRNESASKKDTSRIDDKQVEFIKRIATTDRLNKILADYNLNKLEDMSIEDYNIEYDKLRLEQEDNEEFFENLNVI